MDYRFSDNIAKMEGSAIREIFKYAADPAVISLAGGNPAPELFPGEDLAKIAEKLLREEPVLALQYGISEGYTPLIEAVNKRLEEKENIDTKANQTMIVSGGQQGIELATKTLVNKGEVIIVEEPSFIGATNAFRSYGAQLVGVPMEDDGMDTDALERTITECEEAGKPVKMIYTIPTFQNPTGVTMSQEKREKIYEIAKKHQVVILEDNPYGELSFDGSRQKTIKSIDKDGIVLYNGSFSKVLAPGLRVGYIVGNPKLIGRMVVAKQVSDVHTPMIPQVLAHRFMTTCDMDGLIEKMRENYAHKAKTMLDAIDQYFPKDVKVYRPNGGLFIWCELPKGVDTFEMSKEAVKQQVVYVPGNTFMVDMNKHTNTMRLNYSTMSDERIVEGIKRLAEVLKQ